MSCIYGKLNFDQKPIDTDSLLLMENTLNHFSADDKGIWHKNSVGLGHLMLHNTPESIQEKLPLYQGYNNLSITADARIDNRDELLTKLNLTKQKAVLVPDSTLILKAYEKYGEDCVQHLIGDFVFAIWDEGLQKLFCARDQMGIKPFFYYINKGFFVFATERKGILCLDGVDKTINRQFVYNQLTWKPINTDDITLYQHINRLKPAHTLVVDIRNKKTRTSPYWDLDAEKELYFLNKADYYEGLTYQFEQAVKCRVRTAYPIGSELSGGLDSSAITGAAHRFLTENGQGIVTFSNTIPKGITIPRLLAQDERRYMDDVILFNKIEDAEFITESPFDNILDEIDFALKVSDGIDCYNPLWQLPSRFAAKRKNVRTMLSGFPGDQMVTSLNKTYFIDYLHKKQYLKYFNAKQAYSPKFNKLRPFVPSVMVKGLQKVKAELGYYDGLVKAAATLYNIPAESQKRMNLMMAERKRNRFLDSYRDGQKRILLQPMVYNRLETETSQGLHFRLEPRFPLADIRLTQYYLAMPNYIKYEGDISRSAYRQAVDRYLPESIKKRDDKSGMIAPFMALTNNYWEYLEKVLANIPMDNPLVKIDEVKARIQNLLGADATHSQKKKGVALEDQIPNLELLRWIELNLKNF